ncbi:MAG: ABC transporter permease [Alphaproteobacteria bacterium]
MSIAVIARPPVRSRRGGALRRFVRHLPALISVVVILALVAGAALAPLIARLLGIDPFEEDLFNQYRPPSDSHWLGTDAIGRDVLVRLLYAGRVSLTVGFSGALIASLIGTAIGLAAGYYGGRIDGFLMRITDGIIALPVLPLLIILAALDLGKLGISDSFARSEHASVWRIIVIVSLFGWTTAARLVRASALAVREREFVRAARALGASDLRIIATHILPNILSPLVVATTLAVGQVILVESVLSYLGLGINPPTPSWGGMLTNAQETVSRAPWLAVYPGVTIFLAVLAFNFLGDGLQDALNPRRVRR